MRTTITLEADVAEHLREAQKQSGRSFKETVNELLRAGILTQKRQQDKPKFRVKPLGPGVVGEFESVSKLLEELESETE